MPSKAGGWFDPTVKARELDGGIMPKRANGVRRSGTGPFVNSLKYLSKLSNDKWLVKRITVTYFNSVQFKFTGEISCIGSNGQIRLQYIDWPEMDTLERYSTVAYINTFHSVWIHYKEIDMIIDKNKNVTNEILDILKMKMAQSFVYYFDIKPLNIKMIPKIFKGDYTEGYMQEILTMGNRITANSDFISKAKDLLFDMNRQNKFLLLKKNTFLNEQRRFLHWTTSELCTIVHNYKELFADVLIKNLQTGKYKQPKVDSKPNEDEKETELKVKEEEVITTKKEVDKTGWSSYLDWDEDEIGVEIKKELKRSENRIAILISDEETKNKEWGKDLWVNKTIKVILYDTSSWGNGLPRPYFKNTKPLKKSRWKWRREKNKWLSHKIKKKSLNKQTNRYHHGKKHVLVKKQKKKRRRADVKQEGLFQYDSL